MLHLREIWVGKIDAKNELIKDSKQEKGTFIDTFLIPDNIRIDDFERGNRYFITGLKGTGKTALLRYIALSVEKKNNTSTIFILFKSEFTEQDKADFSRAANTLLAVKNDDPEIDEEFVEIWHWFLHKQIVRLVEIDPDKYFVNDINWEKYRKCVNAPKLGDERSGITRLLPKLKKGNVEVEGDVEFMKAKLGLEFEWDSPQSRNVKFSSIVRQADELFKALHPKENKLFIFLDELELSLGKQKQYQKDIRLIRDVIIAVNDLNIISRRLRFPIFIITAIRSEVITAVQAAGKEINKPIIDFGISLKWQHSGDIKEHPLLRIINRKIQASEKAAGLPISSVEEVWNNYFVDQVKNRPIREYILHRTWYRPRDIVRMLSIAQQQFPNETKFTHSVFDSINKEYSTQSWTEHVEELRTNYSESEIEGIKQMLTALKCPFNLHELLMFCDEKKKNYTKVEQLLNKYKLGDILSHLYKVGIVGNTGQKVRYSFRGDDELVIENSMKIHDPLWNYLSIESRTED